MSAVPSAPTRRRFLATSAAAGAFGLMLLATSSYAQTVPAAGIQGENDKGDALKAITRAMAKSGDMQGARVLAAKLQKIV